MGLKTTPEEIGKRIRDLREKNGETQNNLADALHCKQNNISKMERGKSLTSDNLIAIAEHYNVSMDYLCKGEGGIDLFDTSDSFFNELCSKNLKLDFSNFSLQNQEDVPVVIQFLKQKSKEQVAQYDSLAMEQEENYYNEEIGEPIVRVSKEAKKTIRVILSLSVYSFEKFLKDQEHMQQMMESGVQESNSNGDNLTCCLLYLDGICMVNIDLIKTVTLLCPDAGKEFYCFYCSNSK